MTATLLPAGQDYGETIRTRRVAGFVLRESRFLPGAVLPDHGHARAHLCFVLGGGYTEEIDGRTSRREGRQIILHPEHEMHSNRIAPSGARDLSVEIPPERLDQIGVGTGLFRRPDQLLGGPAVRHALRLYDEFRRTDSASDLAVEGLLLELLAEAARPRRDDGLTASPSWLLRVCERLRERLSENLPLDELAAEAGVHPTHMARAFRGRHGCSIGEYVRRLRVDAACKHLAEGRRTLAEIAAEAGFCDQSHFHRVFRRQVGMTPAAFRRASR